MSRAFMSGRIQGGRLHVVVHSTPGSVKNPAGDDRNSGAANGRGPMGLGGGSESIVASTTVTADRDSAGEAAPCRPFITEFRGLLDLDEGGSRSSATKVAATNPTDTPVAPPTGRLIDLAAWRRRHGSIPAKR